MKILGLREIKKCYPGFEVVHLEKPIILTISPKLAEVANQENPNSCLVACAMEFKFPFHVVPYVFPSVTYIVNLDDKTITICKNSTATTKLIRAYDDDKNSKVVPGEYVLIPFPTSQKNKSNGKTTSGRGTGRPRREAARLFNRRVAESNPYAEIT